MHFEGFWQLVLPEFTHCMRKRKQRSGVTLGWNTWWKKQMVPWFSYLPVSHTSHWVKPYGIHWPWRSRYLALVAWCFRLHLGAGGESPCTSCYMFYICCIRTKINIRNSILYFYCHSFSMSSQAAQTSSQTSCLFDVPFILRHQHLNPTADVTVCRLNLTAATGPRNLLARGMSYRTPASGLIRVNLLGVGNLWTVSVNIFCLITMFGVSPLSRVVGPLPNGLSIQDL